MKLRIGVVAVMAAAAAGLGACGASSPGPSSTTVAPTSSARTGTMTSGTSGRMKATLRAENHTPTIGIKWEYVVEATDGHGRPLTGTVATQFLFGGSVVGHESPPSHPLRHGRLVDKVTYTPPSNGIHLVFEVVVTTPLGKVTLDWPVVPKENG